MNRPFWDTVELRNKYIRMTRTDGVVFDIPVNIIAYHRAQYYAHEFDGYVSRSLAKDTVPLFLDDDYNILDWAENNMDWEDVKEFARRIPKAFISQMDIAIDKQKEWIESTKEIVEYE